MKFRTCIEINVGYDEIRISKFQKVKFKMLVMQYFIDCGRYVVINLATILVVDFRHILNEQILFYSDNCCIFVQSARDRHRRCHNIILNRLINKIV